MGKNNLKNLQNKGAETGIEYKFHFWELKGY